MNRIAVVALLGFLFAGCQDQVQETVAPDDAAVRGQKGGPGGSPQQTAVEGKINKLLNELFPGQKQDEANKLFASVKSALARGDTTAAQSSVSDLVQLASSTDLEDPKGSRSAAEGFSDLIDLLFEFVGLEPPEVDPSLFADDDDDDGTVQLAVDGQNNLILSDSVWAGTFIEDEDIDQTLLIVLDRLTTDEQDTLPDGECLPTDSLPQEEGCYRFDRFPEGVFQDSVKVGVCPEATIANDESYQLHEFEAASADTNAVSGIVPLPNESFSQLQCGGFSVVQSPAPPLPWRLAEAAWSATGGQLLSWFGPAPLWAIDAGSGGSTLDYSRIGWAKQMDVDIVQGDNQSAPPGAEVSTAPTVRVTHLPESDDDNPIQGADVTFEIMQGGGTLNVGSNFTVTDTTDANGEVAVDWTLGTPGTNELEAAVTGSQVSFTANAGDTIFAADFNDEPAGSVPQDPHIGEWSSILGDVAIATSKGDLTAKPVTLTDPTSLGSFPIFNGKTSVVVDSGTYVVTGQMLVDLNASNGRGSFKLKDPGGPRIALIEMEGDGDILAGTGLFNLSDTGMDWTTDVARTFELEVDLDALEVSLSIDTTPVFQNDSLPTGATSLQRVEMLSNAGGTPPGIAAFDDIVVVRNP